MTTFFITVVYNRKTFPVANISISFWSLTNPPKDKPDMQTNTRWSCVNAK